MTKHRRGPWSQNEDHTLLQLVHSQGAHNWVRISQLLGSRSPKQCRERYHQNLKPSLNLEPISAEEGLMIERMVADMGKRWAEIARRLHGRSDNAVKNWWNGGMNRRKRLDNRRADAAARQQHQHQQQHAGPSSSSSASYLNVASSYQQQHPPHPAAVQPSAAFDQRPVYPPNNLYPHHIQTSHLNPGARRHMVDTPLPSPGALSTQSHAESMDGAPPSLVSEISSYHSQSPNTPPVHKELPPLTLGSDPRRMSYQAPVFDQQQQQDYRRLSYPSAVHVDQHGHTYAIDPMLQTKAMPPPPQQQQQQHQQHYWHKDHQQQQQQQQQQQNPRSVPFAGQLPLPPFSPTHGPEQHRYHTGPPSPPRDSRMNLKSVLQ